jgi:hypothetical protein
VPICRPRRTSPLRLACALVVVAALAAPAAGALSTTRAGTIDLLEAFGYELPKVKRTTRVPVLLPRALRLAGPAPKVYASSGADRRGWVLTLAGVPRCGGASACFIASFEGQRGKPLPERANVRLAAGARGFYLPIGCGASCSPASLWFVHDGALYSWQVKDPLRNARAALVRMANEAIRAGPR